MLVNFMSIYFLSHCLHKFHSDRLNGGLFEGEDIISCLYAGGQGAGEVGGGFLRGIISLFVVGQLGCKTRCFWKNGLGGRNVHICKEGNEDKYLWYESLPLVFIFNSFDSP